MNLWKSPAGSYHLWLNRRECPPHGKRMSLRKIAGHTVYDESEAVEYLKELQANWHQQKIIELTQGKKHPLDKFKTEYLEFRKHLSESTTRMDDMTLRFFMEVVGDKKSIEAIRKKHINLFVSVLHGRGVTPKSINSYLRHLRAAYNTACELYDIRPIKIKLLKVDSPLPRILTKDEIDRILKYAKENDCEMWRIIKFAIWTGLRRQELLSIDYASISNGRITVKGKGGKVRVVPLPGEIADTYDQAVDIGYVFARWHKDTISKRFKVIVDAVGIAGAKFHSLRHSAATYMIESGMHPKAVQTVLGHADFRTTELYVNIHNEWIASEMEKFRI